MIYEILSPGYAVFEKFVHSPIVYTMQRVHDISQHFADFVHARLEILLLLDFTQTLSAMLRSIKQPEERERVQIKGEGKFLRIILTLETGQLQLY